MRALVWRLESVREDDDGSYTLTWRGGVGIRKTTRATAEQLAQVQARQQRLGLPVPKEAA